MKRLHELKAAVVGSGFIGAVHVDALRRLGVHGGYLQDWLALPRT